MPYQYKWQTITEPLNELYLILIKTSLYIISNKTVQIKPCIAIKMPTSISSNDSSFSFSILTARRVASEYSLLTHMFMFS